MPCGCVAITLSALTVLQRCSCHTYVWDGRTRDDGTAPPGRYKLRVKLLGQERTLVTPGVIKLHRGKARGPKATVEICGYSAAKQPHGAAAAKDSAP